MAMSGMRQVEVGLEFVHRTPPEAILAEGAPAVLRSIPRDRRKAAIELAHWGYGAAAGTLFALVPKRLRGSRITGPLYGALMWGAFELAIAPSLGLAHAHRTRPRERWALLVDHVVFGFIVGAPPETVVSGTGNQGGEDGGSGRDGRRRRGQRGRRPRS
ncbi:hypothetical protein [Nocardiopsis halotolerans]|uniref:hypothetical protein n=1 Tax=Nocardiopsis halotolerans TaxID=124252 RepID=UPI00037901DB|nr:hypothetical protein [Nocardiopsis halotolerans]